MFVLKKTHKKAMADWLEITKETVAAVKKRAESDQGMTQRALDAERSINDSLRAEIESMKPDFLFGQQRRLQNQRAGQKRKAKRAAK
jgi:hypothetical protein